ncbi:hypothetical protein A2U01_0035766, partial [Trifolium medium]|nr:hypothetical protein [Trifolium medium]
MLRKLKKKVNKKQRSEWKKAPRVIRRMKIQDDEENDEEPLVNKKRKTDPEQVKQSSEGMDTEADTAETQTQSQQSSPLQILEQHLQGELPQSSEPTFETTSTAEAKDNQE